MCGYRRAVQLQILLFEDFVEAVGNQVVAFGSIYRNKIQHLWSQAILQALCNYRPISRGQNSCGEKTTSGPWRPMERALPFVALI